MNIRLKERTANVFDKVVEHFLINDRGACHVPQRALDLAPKIAQHHLGSSRRNRTREEKSQKGWRGGEKDERRREKRKCLLLLLVFFFFCVCVWRNVACYSSVCRLCRASACWLCVSCRVPDKRMSTLTGAARISNAAHSKLPKNKKQKQKTNQTKPLPHPSSQSHSHSSSQSHSSPPPPPLPLVKREDGAQARWPEEARGAKAKPP